ncbi:ethylene-responsive transcription factor ABR1-like [Miscanthus floridulus]|uniref:ethylene-responsive transcription factor ABR1-like n=1 Tax=Miscanthus floridulus TaxID=154761 RepID=UPI00345815C8
MEGGGSIIELARKAAALARTEQAARLAAMRPVRNYRGVQQRKNRYYSVIRNIHTRRLVWLGSYKTPEEAAYAWDAAARVTRGHWAKPNFPEPAWARAAPAPEEVSTELVLALSTPAAPVRRREPSAAVAAQVSFDNWLLSASAAAEEPQRQQRAPAVVPPHQQQGTAPALPAFTQFFHLSGPATAAAAANGGAAVVNPSNPGACVLTPQNVQMPPTNPASTVLSSTEPIVLASQFLPAAAPTHHRELPVSQAGVSDLAVVGDNFTHDGASTSAAAPPVPRLTPKDLLLQIGLPGRGGPGGAQ